MSQVRPVTRAKLLFGSTNDAGSVPGGVVRSEARGLRAPKHAACGAGAEPALKTRGEPCAPAASSACEESGSFGVPAASSGPVYLEGRLVLSLSFQGNEAIDLSCVADKKAALARYRLWDDVANRWYAGGFTVLRFEGLDVVMRRGKRPVAVWKGALDTRKRVVLAPDLDEEGFEQNQSCDLRWKVV